MKLWLPHKMGEEKVKDEHTTSKALVSFPENSLNASTANLYTDNTSDNDSWSWFRFLLIDMVRTRKMLTHSICLEINRLTTASKFDAIHIEGYLGTEGTVIEVVPQRKLRPPSFSPVGGRFKKNVNKTGQKVKLSCSESGSQT